MKENSVRRYGTALVFVALSLFVGGWVCRFMVAADLDRKAESDWQRYRQGSSPFLWVFATAADIAAGHPPGLAKARFQSNGLSGLIGPSGVDISLNLSAQKIDAELLDRARLVLSTDGPITLTVLFSETLTSPAISSAPIPLSAGAHDFLLTLKQLTWQEKQDAMRWGGTSGSLATVRLHFQAAPGTALILSRWELQPSMAPAAPVFCQGQRDIGATLAACGSRPVFVKVPDYLTPEPLLAWRDRLRTAWPSALPFAGRVPLDAAVSPAAGSNSSSVLMAVLGLLAMAMGARRIKSNSWQPSLPMRAALELFVFGAAAIAIFISLTGGGTITAWIVIGLLLAAWVWPEWMPLPNWRGDIAAWRASMGVTLVGVVLLGLVAAFSLEQGESLRPFSYARMPRYLAFAVLQQAVLVRALAGRTRWLTADRLHAALLAGLLFAVLHLPNFALFCATFAAGTAWAWIGLRHQTLLPQIVSHAVLGTLLLPLTPVWLVRGAEIGGRFSMPL